MKRGVKRRMVTKKNNHDEETSHKIKRIFYIFLDIIILISFSLSLYFTCVLDYTRTIIFLIIGTLLLLFFIIKRAFKRRDK